MRLTVEKNLVLLEVDWWLSDSLGLSVSLGLWGLGANEWDVALEAVPGAADETWLLSGTSGSSGSSSSSNLLAWDDDLASVGNINGGLDGVRWVVGSVLSNLLELVLEGVWNLSATSLQSSIMLDGLEVLVVPCVDLGSNLGVAESGANSVGDWVGDSVEGVADASWDEGLAHPVVGSGTLVVEGVGGRGDVVTDESTLLEVELILILEILVVVVEEEVIVALEVLAVSNGSGVDWSCGNGGCESRDEDSWEGGGEESHFECEEERVTKRSV